MKIMKKYPLTKYEWGVQYNTVGPRKVIINYWNRGVRITVDTFYPQGDNSKQLKFGTTVFTRGLDDYEDKNTWYQHYYYLNSDKFYSSNGKMDHLAVFVRQF